MSSALPELNTTKGHNHNMPVAAPELHRSARKRKLILDAATHAEVMTPITNSGTPEPPSARLSAINGTGARPVAAE